MECFLDVYKMISWVRLHICLVRCWCQNRLDLTLRVSFRQLPNQHVTNRARKFIVKELSVGGGISYTREDRRIKDDLCINVSCTNTKKYMGEIGSPLRSLPMIL